VVTLLWHIVQIVIRLEGWSRPPLFLGWIWWTSVIQEGTLERSFPHRRHLHPSLAITLFLIIRHALLLMKGGTYSSKGTGSFRSLEKDL
jgi:hypothetical protein